MSNESTILRGLLAHLRELVTGDPAALVIAVEWPDDDFTPPTQAGDPLPYLRPDILPANPSNIAVTGGTTVHVGVFQISVYWPQRKWALIEATAIADQIADHFGPEPNISYDGVRIDVNVRPTVGPRVPAGSVGMPHIPVSVFYNARIAA